MQATATDTERIAPIGFGEAAEAFLAGWGRRAGAGVAGGTARPIGLTLRAGWLPTRAQRQFLDLLHRRPPGRSFGEAATGRLAALYHQDD